MIRSDIGCFLTPDWSYETNRLSEFHTNSENKAAATHCIHLSRGSASFIHLLHILLLKKKKKKCRDSFSLYGPLLSAEVLRERGCKVLASPLGPSKNASEWPISISLHVTLGQALVT